jgi:hypothetical protein
MKLIIGLIQQLSKYFSLDVNEGVNLLSSKAQTVNVKSGYHYAYVEYQCRTKNRYNVVQVEMITGWKASDK